MSQGCSKIRRSESKINLATSQEHKNDIFIEISIKIGW